MTSDSHGIAAIWIVGALASIPLALGQEKAPAAPPGEAREVEERTDLVAAVEVLGTTLRNHEQGALGSLDDLVIERSSGRVVLAAVGIGVGLGREDAAKAVAWKDFRWDAEAERVRLSLDAEELAKRPDYSRTRLAGLVAQVAPASAPGSGRPVEASGSGDPEHEAAATRDRPTEGVVLHHTVTALRGSEVLAAKGETLGWVVDVVLEPRAGATPFATLRRRYGDGEEAGRLLVLPWTAIRANEEGALAVERPLAELSEAPHLEKVGTGELESEEFQREVHEFWGVDPPPFLRSVASPEEKGT